MPRTVVERFRVCNANDGADLPRPDAVQQPQDRLQAATYLFPLPLERTDPLAELTTQLLRGLQTSLDGQTRAR
ncbi:MAG TPA: hypothetical protein VGR62_15610 [Candidatus Binatia bacterium]|nr:hypothetical protein [Candidatus Binatia bacterium]